MLDGYRLTAAACAPADANIKWSRTVQAYRIVNWKKLYEVTARGKPATADTPMAELRKSPIPFIRRPVIGHSLPMDYRRFVKKAYELGDLMEMACIGLYDKLVDLAGDQEREYRGWILDDRQRKMSPCEVAAMLEVKGTQRIEAAFDLLCDPEVKLLELVELPFVPPASPSVGGEKGKDAKSLLNETETEIEVRSLRETDKGVPGNPPGQGESTAAQPTVSVTGLGPDSVPVSEKISDTVSAPAPDAASVSEAGPQYSPEEVRIQRQLAALRLTEIIRPKTTGDHTTFVDLLDQIAGKMVTETDEDLFEMMLTKAKQCCRLDRPIAVFVAAMKKSPFNYIPKGTQIIKGALDNRYRGRH